MFSYGSYYQIKDKGQEDKKEDDNEKRSEKDLVDGDDHGQYILPIIVPLLLFWFIMHRNPPPFILSWHFF